LFVLTLWLTFVISGQGRAMSKTLITIPEGNLLRVAATKSITTLTALKEKTGVDRKTLRAINEGKQVKEMTLERIAIKLHVPLAYLHGPTSTPNESEDVSGVNKYQFREIRLQRLDAAALRERLAWTSEITWFLKIDHMSESLEEALKNLRESLRRWSFNLSQIEDPGADNFDEEMSRIKSSTDIDKCLEQLTQHKLKIYGGDYVRWTKERPRHQIEDYPLPILKYRSHHMVALCIAPEDKNISTVRVATGWEPPQKFDESELADFDTVEVDFHTVWLRDEIPF
jgi:DNA-binding Xre family transcriptional regulator